ncbi:MAG: hypothetical protein P0Y53_24690 [Candidatus Pseudobacter hemicellulosilyticus]|uniref:Uncharacterized protein n=1 Tax=Candidatus Pseudobacter hemicellulosilyticus TaxID=3121375 RepID=A0AAJ5WS55_9BACT|nr:MAG: hypothetical protein P0Y53_24690 [Pseudobacter sp.]
MERLEQLISKLNEQFEQNADPSQLLVTTQLLEAELVQLATASRKKAGSSKVAVVMPAGRYGYSTVNETAVVADPVVVEESRPVRLPEEKLPAPEEAVMPAPLPQEAYVPEPEPVPVNGSALPVNGTNGTAPAANGWHFDPLKEIPTLAHQTANGKEVNELMGEAAVSSLNDKLKEEVVEVGHRLTDSPVRDLKKAIGINDRFVFISELFRGDEVMYERSIKTINGFRIFPEAEYWIERELKVKLGWDELKPTTRHFYQLVKRRFS